MNSTFHHKSYNWSVSCLSVMEYAPQIIENDIAYRPSLSFLAVIRGEYHYYFNNETIIVKEGDVLFLPKSIAYKYTIHSEDTYTMQVTFDIFPEESSAILPRKPLVLDSQSSLQIITIFPKLISSFRKNSIYSTFSVNSILFQFMAIMMKQTEPSPYCPQIEPAIKYLEQNFNSDFSISDLAAQCNISPSQLRRLFVNETGLSPLKYKNKLRMEEAYKLLESREMNISEIANAMNFDSLYSFSKFFKRESGVSPQNWKPDHSIVHM